MHLEQKIGSAQQNIHLFHRDVQRQVAVLTTLSQEKKEVQLACKKYSTSAKHYEKPLCKKIERCVYVLKEKENALRKLETRVNIQAIDHETNRSFEKIKMEILKIREEINFHFCFGSATNQLKKAGFWRRLFGVHYVDFALEDAQKWVDAKTKTLFHQIHSFHQDPLTKREWIDICTHIENNKYQWFNEIHTRQLTHLYIRHGDPKGTHRTLRIDADGKIYLILKVCLGNGTFKKARLALDYTANTLCGNAVTKIENDTYRCVENEIQMTNQLKGQSHIIQFQNAVEYSGNKRGENDSPFNKVGIMMDFCNCGDLSNLLRAGLLLTPAQKRQLVTDILKGVQTTHKARIVHRDLKIENIFVNREFEADGSVLYRGRVGDYGLACKLDEESKLKKAVGTRYAFAPEVWELKDPLIKNKKAVGLPSDYYSLGILLAELLGIKIGHMEQFRTLKISHKPLMNEPGYLVWMLTQRDPKLRINVSQALALLDKIDWSIDKKYAVRFVPV
jgi:hypothetical protein